MSSSFKRNTAFFNSGSLNSYSASINFVRDFPDIHLAEVMVINGFSDEDIFTVRKTRDPVVNIIRPAFYVHIVGLNLATTSSTN
jgi:hypothetical protein